MSVIRQCDECQNVVRDARVFQMRIRELSIPDATENIYDLCEDCLKNKTIVDITGNQILVGASDHDEPGEE